MPTLVRQDGFRIMIHTDDHIPPHVHAYKAGAVLIVNLEPLTIRESIGLSRNEERQALSIIAEHYDMLLAAWNRIHS